MSLDLINNIKIEKKITAKKKKVILSEPNSSKTTVKEMDKSKILDSINNDLDDLFKTQVLNKSINIQKTIRVPEEFNNWITKISKEKNISKNDIVRTIIKNSLEKPDLLNSLVKFNKSGLKNTKNLIFRITLEEDNNIKSYISDNPLFNFSSLIKSILFFNYSK